VFGSVTNEESEEALLTGNMEDPPGYDRTKNSKLLDTPCILKWSYESDFADC
jgi:hypothetical protein